ncbi:hypothetical protein GCM10027275_55450 [Rhabdobacter roseus]|uniref:DUF5672 domain-containing protein n=1 Tax=Rhabdobacter roseus TaxID=1655419 RepID=A0A840TWD2_9BACT|nr:hypothetical protein [Rhabdobacter roseus]
MREVPPRPNAVIVIPLYKAALSPGERQSLRQCLHVLAAYPIVLIKPHGLAISSLLQEFPKLKVQSFDDRYFTSIDTYNQLMVSVAFYQTFGHYEYMLLYQLDAYVFRDELPLWCQKGYDYVGAPALETEAVDQLPAAEHERYARALDTTRPVLNGGLSLRRIPSLIRYLRIYHFFYSAWPGNEDKLFSLDARRLAPMKYFIRLPTWREALFFSFEKSPAASYALTGRQLPFGCHAWERYDPDFWVPFMPTNS